MVHLKINSVFIEFVVPICCKWYIGQTKEKYPV